MAFVSLIFDCTIGIVTNQLCIELSVNKRFQAPHILVLIPIINTPYDIFADSAFVSISAPRFMNFNDCFPFGSTALDLVQGFQRLLSVCRHPQDLSDSLLRPPDNLRHLVSIQTGIKAFQRFFLLSARKKAPLSD